MMFKGNNLFNASFDVYAHNYHSVRPGYPQKLFDDVREQCSIVQNSHVLEIGAGSGIATVELAKLGCHVTAIEPGTNLAMIARKQTEAFDNVEVYEGMFEDFRSPEKFDAIMAFTAFHWLSEGDKFEQILSLLHDSGALVLIWNSFFQSDSPVMSAINQAYNDQLPDIYPDVSEAGDVNRGVLEKLHKREKELFTNSSFYTVFLKKYVTNYNYDEETYPMLLNTFPKIVKIDDERRLKFLQRVADIVKQYGKVPVPILTTLIICQKRDDFIKAMSKTEGGL